MELLHAPVRLPLNAEEMLLRIIWLVGAAMILVVSGGIAVADGPVDPAAVKSEDGKYSDKEGNPTLTAWGRVTPLPSRIRSRR